MNRLLTITIISISALLLTTDANAQTEFITLWKPGTANPQSIALPIMGSNMTISWEEVGFEATHNGTEGPITDNDDNLVTATTVNFGNAQNTNPAAATYRVKVTGGLERFYADKAAELIFGGGVVVSYAQLEKLQEIQQWGSSIDWTSMRGAFSKCQNMQLTATDAPKLTMVSDMSSMFSECTAFTGHASMNSWNTTNVTNMSNMFYKATAFNQLIDGWTTTSVTNMSSLFEEANAFNQNLSSWKTTNVTDMSRMFYNATAFNKPIGNWNTTSLQNMSFMFYNADAFNQPLTGWNTNNVTDMTAVFDETAVFNQPLTSWNTANVTNMEAMFFTAAAFDQNLGGWNISSVTSMADMLTNSGMSCVNYGRTLIGWVDGGTAPDNITLDATGLVYSHDEAVTAHNKLTDAVATGGYNWMINGDTYNSTVCKHQTLPATFGSVTAQIKNGMLRVNWQTLTEKNINHFKIEISKDGKTWKEAGSHIGSKAKNGNSDTVIEYNQQMPLSAAAVMGISLLLLSLPIMRRNKWLSAAVAIVGISAMLYGCKKSEHIITTKDEKIYVRIVQVDKDGSIKYSKVITAVVE